MESIGEFFKISFIFREWAREHTRVRAGQGGESEDDSMLSVEPNTGLNQFWRIYEQTANRITLAPMLKPDWEQEAIL